MKKQKEKKNSIIPLIICVAAMISAVICLPSVNNIFWKSNTNDEKELKEKIEKIPSRFQCSYGPSVDSFYNYIKSEYVIFNFDESGNVSSLNSEIKYQVTTLNDYNQMLTLIELPSENTIYDSENYVVTVTTTTSNIFPNNYKELKQYLSTNQYTCVEE